MKEEVFHQEIGITNPAELIRENSSLKLAAEKLAWALEFYATDTERNSEVATKALAAYREKFPREKG